MSRLRPMVALVAASVPLLVAVGALPVPATTGACTIQDTDGDNLLEFGPG